MHKVQNKNLANSVLPNSWENYTHYSKNCLEIALKSLFNGDVLETNNPLLSKNKPYSFF
jgi:hypothetical protein